MSNPSIAGVLFDKDGTLLDFIKTWTPIISEAALFAARGDEALAEHFLRVGGLDRAAGTADPHGVIAAAGTTEIAAAWIAAGARFDLAALTRSLDAIFSASARAVVPVTDLAGFFARLKRRGLKLGVASSDNERSIHITARHFGFADSLDFIAGYDSGHGIKPQPGMVLAFCRAVGLSPAQVAMVGDTPHDLAMGRAAGVGRAIGVLTGTGTVETLSPYADVCLSSIETLEDVLFPA